MRLPSHNDQKELFMDSERKGTNNKETFASWIRDLWWLQLHQSGVWLQQKQTIE